MAKKVTSAKLLAASKALLALADCVDIEEILFDNWQKITDVYEHENGRKMFTWEWPMTDDSDLIQWANTFSTILTPESES